MIFSRLLAIDMGSAVTRVIADGKGILYNEPTLIAVTEDKDTLAGCEAESYIRGVFTGARAKRPIQGGVIADWDLARKLLSGIIRKLCGRERRQYIKAVMCVPQNITKMEREAFEDVAKASGIGELCLVPSAAAAAAAIDMTSPAGQLVVDIGAEKSESAVIAMGGIVSGGMIRTGGSAVTARLCAALCEKYDVMAGIAVGEALKKTVFEEESVQASGRNLKTGLPQKITVTKKDVLAASESFFEEITELIRGSIARTPPELMGDIIKNGILLTGGGSALGGLSQRISERLGLTVREEEARELLSVTGAYKTGEMIFALKKGREIIGREA